MNSKILGLLTVILLLPIASNAQVTTLYYQSDFLSGTSTYVPDAGVSTAIAATPFIGAITAEMTLDGSLAANNLTLTSLDINFSGSNGINLTGSNSSIFQYSASPAFTLIGTGGAGGFTGNLQLIATPSGAITGATMLFVDNCNGCGVSVPTFATSIGAGGDSFAYQLSLGSLGGCTNLLAGGFTGGFTGTVNPCSINVSNSTPGAWVIRTQAPEIDPISASSGLALLLGGLLVVRGRRTVETQAT